MEKTNGVIKIKLKDKEYKACLDMNAIAWIEDTYDIAFDKLIANFESGELKLGDVRKIIGGILQYDAIEKDLDEYTKKDINKIISGIQLQELLEIINQSMGKLINQ